MDLLEQRDNIDIIRLYKKEEALPYRTSFVALIKVSSRNLPTANASIRWRRRLYSTPISTLPKTSPSSQ